MDLPSPGQLCCVWVKPERIRTVQYICVYQQELVEIVNLYYCAVQYSTVLYSIVCTEHVTVPLSCTVLYSTVHSRKWVVMVSQKLRFNTQSMKNCCVFSSSHCTALYSTWDYTVLNKISSVLRRRTGTHATHNCNTSHLINHSKLLLVTFVSYCTFMSKVIFS